MIGDLEMSLCTLRSTVSQRLYQHCRLSFKVVQKNNNIQCRSFNNMTVANYNGLAAKLQSSAQVFDAKSELQIPETHDDASTRHKYRPFLLDERVAKNDWISKLELDTVEDMVQSDLAATGGDRIRVLVLFGSLRSR